MDQRLIETLRTPKKLQQRNLDQNEGKGNLITHKIYYIKNYAGWC